MSPSGSGGNGGMNGTSTSYRSQSPELDSPSRGHGADRDRYIYVSKMRERPYKEKYIGKFYVSYRFVTQVQRDEVFCCCKVTSSSKTILSYRFVAEHSILEVVVSFGSTRGQWHSGFSPWNFLLLREEFHS